MYHAIVRHRLRQVFAALNAGRADTMPAQFAPGALHSFSGDHALAGTRRTAEGIAAWYRRLPRVLPDLTFEIERIVVAGWPWRTQAMVEWRDHGVCADGSTFANRGVHSLTLRWGRVTALHIHCDTAVLNDVLRRQAAAGIPDAAAPPIGDRPQAMGREAARG